MTTVLQVRAGTFVSTPAIERIASRALRYLQSGFSVHLRGPAGTGKTTMAMHLAERLARPIMLIFGDDEFTTADLIGNQSGYTRKKVVDNYIHSVVKVEDELRQNWVDSRLTLACREGLTLVYDEFNRSRPEVNNVLLSALEEKLLAMPPSANRMEYIRVDANFRAIFTSNPEEYCGVHNTQDALMDRLITINFPEPDELTQQEILCQKIGISREEARLIVRLVRSFRVKIGAEKSSGLRSCLMVAKVCHEHEIRAVPENADFRDICGDVLLSRANMPRSEATTILWELLNSFFLPESSSHFNLVSYTPAATEEFTPAVETASDLVTSEISAEITSTEATLCEQPEQAPELLEPELTAISELVPDEQVEVALALLASKLSTEIAPTEATLCEQPEQASELSEPELTTISEPVPGEQDVYNFLLQADGASLLEIETALSIDRLQAVNALRSLVERGIVTHDGTRIYVVYEDETTL
ncbi:MAG TPA: gas vesicle protein GvpN [Cyanobacteria bacterium UBA11049]|nr:gas vesicle protein GvpN [Cyanobacteria bacterium UBA11049]